MTRKLYILLLHSHPRAFRERFGEEMLGIFELSSGKASLLADGFVSLFRQWTLRRKAAGLSPTVAADGVPVFFSAGPEVPPAGAFVPGIFITVLAFTFIYFTISHRWRQTSLVVGSHHPSPSHILGAHTDAVPVADLPAEVKVSPYPFHPPISAYFRLILVLGALDADQDNVISAAEIENAPAALWKLDKNHDGKLTAEECGLKPDPNLDAVMRVCVRQMFMRIHPVLWALDTNHDGEISEDEIRNASRALRTVDFNRDGKLTEAELLPDRDVMLAANLMLTLDEDGDGKISRRERKGPLAERFRDLLNRADQDGFVTEEALLKALGR